MTLHHSAMPPDDLEESRAIRFHFRGDKDLVACLVSWDALDQLEDGKATQRAERMARFERHRSKIEAAALRKLDHIHPGDHALRLEAADVLSAPTIYDSAS
ncbi:DUF1488 family protein [Ancylobacter sp. VNQ12]|uniref:DUF1488 family protein n=1 Tax=Ancylobacter sp. VNQ12 TaxID=3400920 RepID=UPI003C1263AD